MCVFVCQCVFALMKLIILGMSPLSVSNNWLAGLLHIGKIIVREFYNNNNNNNVDDYKNNNNKSTNLVQYLGNHTCNKHHNNKKHAIYLRFDSLCIKPTLSCRSWMCLSLSWIACFRLLISSVLDSRFSFCFDTCANTVLSSQSNVELLHSEEDGSHSNRITWN